MLIAGYADARDLKDVEVALVTPEEEPLQLFGTEASSAARALFAERGITLHTHAYATEAKDGQLHVVPEAAIAADRVVALPRLYGQPIDGIPHTRDGFIVVDEQSRVAGFRDVFAIGDVTNFPVKQGGIAAQQADAAAEAIAADLGAIPKARPFRPVLRGLLLTGRTPRYLRHEVSGGHGGTSTVSLEPLWWPPAKIVGRHLAPFLAGLAGAGEPEQSRLRRGRFPSRSSWARTSWRARRPGAAPMRLPKRRSTATGKTGWSARSCRARCSSPDPKTRWARSPSGCANAMSDRRSCPTSVA